MHAAGAGWRISYITSILACGFAAWWWLRAGGGPVLALDDAWIVLANARALAAGAPAAMDGPDAPLLLGATSLLYSLAAVPAALSPSPEAALAALNWLGVAAAAAGALTMARRAGVSPPWAMLLTAACFIGGTEPGYVLINGLETSWTLALLFWLFAALLRDPVSRTAALVCGIAPFLRPELGVFSAAAMLRMAWLLRGDARAAAARAALCLGPALALLAAQWALSGAPLPTTGSAKRLFFGVAAMGIPERAFGYAVTLARFLGSFGLLWLAFLVPAERGGAVRTVSAAALALAALSAAWYGHVAGQNEGRVLWGLIPALALGTAAALAAPARSAGGALARLAVAGTVLWLGASFPERALQGVRHAVAGEDRRQAMADWIAETLPPGAELIAHDVGYITWAGHAKIIDMVGLRRPESLDAMRAAGAETIGAAAAPGGMLAVAQQEGTCVALVSTGWNGWLGFDSGAEKLGWRVERLPTPGGAGFLAFRLHAPSGPCAA
ncbi:hypothetical protein ACQ5SO_04755 [Rhodovulum sp. DZ06]|uniref:hypothetical protein n=1 Tax=Rhodovulum sp. DZ06 TaxID=3425126 RepID=UPI003D346D80